MEAVQWLTSITEVFVDKARVKQTSDVSGGKMK